MHTYTSTDTCILSVRHTDIPRHEYTHTHTHTHTLSLSLSLSLMWGLWNENNLQWKNECISEYSLFICTSTQHVGCLWNENIKRKMGLCRKPIIFPKLLSLDYQTSESWQSIQKGEVFESIKEILSRNENTW